MSKELCTTREGTIRKQKPVTTDLVKKTNHNAKTNEIEGKIPSVNGLGTNSALTGVENKIPNVSSLVKKKKTDYNTKINEIEEKLTDHNHDKFISTPEFNKFPADVFP